MEVGDWKLFVAAPRQAGSMRSDELAKRADDRFVGGVCWTQFVRWPHQTQGRVEAQSVQLGQVSCARQAKFCVVRLHLEFDGIAAVSLPRSVQRDHPKC